MRSPTTMAITTLRTSDQKAADRIDFNMESSNLEFGFCDYAVGAAPASWAAVVSVWSKVFASLLA